MKKYFESIIWPKKERVRKEFLIVMIGTLVFGALSFGIDTLARFILNNIF